MEIETAVGAGADANAGRVDVCVIYCLHMVDIGNQLAIVCRNQDAN